MSPGGLLFTIYSHTAVFRTCGTPSGQGLHVPLTHVCVTPGWGLSSGHQALACQPSCCPPPGSQGQLLPAHLLTSAPKFPLSAPDLGQPPLASWSLPVADATGWWPPARRPQDGSQRTADFQRTSWGWCGANPNPEPGCPLTLLSGGGGPVKGLPGRRGRPAPPHPLTPHHKGHFTDEETEAQGGEVTCSKAGIGTPLGRPRSWAVIPQALHPPVPYAPPRLRPR